MKQVLLVVLQDVIDTGVAEIADTVEQNDFHRGVDWGAALGNDQSPESH